MSIIYESVKKFYEEIPFNYEESASEQAETIRRVNQIEAYLPLARRLSENPGAQILEIGCGTGWFSNSAAYWYGVNVLGVDCCLKAVEQARATSEELNVADKVQIICHDLFELPKIVQTEFDVVNSLGVLHHTKDCFEGLKIAASMLKSGGYLNIGLYHRFGRHALLEMFRPIRERLLHADTPSQREEIEREGFELWKNLHNKPFSDVFLKSWYRDQCLHPHETQWTLKDVLEWFGECGIQPINTSLDHFSEDPCWDRLVETEHEQYELGRRRLLFEKKFFPGFFVVGGIKTRDLRSCRHSINRDDTQNKVEPNNKEESDAVSGHHAVFSLFKCSGDKPGNGWLHDFLGVRTRETFFNNMENYDPSSYPDYDEQYFEWTDVLEAACSSSGRFVMIELGAGWGRWLIRAATALRKINHIPSLLIGVEAEPDHYRWMVQHFLDNGIDPDSHQLIEAAVSDRDGNVMFYTGRADEWYGQAIAGKITASSSAKDIRSVSLNTLLAPLDSVDLIDLDVQGEELSVLSAASAELDRKVKKVHIGTHSLQVEKGLRAMFGKMGWISVYDFPCGGTSTTQYGDIIFLDGVQTWINPKLLKHSQLPDTVIKIMGVSFLEETESKPELLRVIPRINKYIGMGKTGFASRIIKAELGCFDKALPILLKLDMK
ncbi:MAG: class I SAM-dependent methyltransferase [Nitrospirae bacterium]|nr:class I SAM-dependent methyltransferase [Nitrospirota bacterium]